MLFCSIPFVFLFLPIFLFGYCILYHLKNKNILSFWIIMSSTFFYGYWHWQYVFLIFASIFINYGIYLLIHRYPTRKKLSATIAVIANILLIGYYKYANFFVENVNAIVGTNYILENIILPLGISFYTFQQIAFIVDAYKGYAKNYSFIDYSAFILFFPQLVAGPIVHHGELIPQLQNYKPIKFDSFSNGTFIFSIGLLKKLFFADFCASIANPVYNAVDQGIAITPVEAWDACIGYTMQIYFDFSGYSDMAIGLALMLGITLPTNFCSPYKASNIIDFWRRWHITLSRFLRDYLYIPFGGNRKGNFRKFVNLFLTMLIGGLWHGAAYTFVFWGALHGFYLICNHGWIAATKALKLDWIRNIFVYRAFAAILTFICVAIAWIFFRATSFNSAFVVIQSLFDLNVAHLFSQGNGLIDSHNVLPLGFSFAPFHRFTLCLLAMISFFVVNTGTMLEYIEKSSTEKKSFFLGMGIFIILLLSVMLIGRENSSDFIYFNF